MGGTDTEEMARFAMFDKSFDLLNLCNYEEGLYANKAFHATICDPILENGAYCGIYDFALEHTKDEKVTLCRNSFYCINMFYKEIPFV